MTPASPARRRADEFDRLVESLRRGGDAASSGSSGSSEPAGSSAGPAELRRLASLATALGQLPVPQPRAEFSADLRERLMAAAATELTPSARTSGDAATGGTRDRLTVGGLTGTAPKQRRQRRLTIAIAALAVVGGTAGTALASQNALPGDTLYPVKRAIENIQTGLSQGEESKGRTLIADANTRLSEIDQLSAGHRAADAAEIASTLTAFSQQAQHGSTLLMQEYQTTRDPAAIATLHQFAKQGIDQLGQIAPALPAGTSGALAEATRTLVSIDQAAEQLCPTCGALGITQLPSGLLTSADQALHQLSGGAGTLPGGTTASTGATGGLSGITLPKLNAADLPPATVPSVLPTALPGVSGAGGITSAAPSPTTTTKHHHSSGTSSSANPTSAASTLDDTLKKATGGVGDLVGGAIRGLLGGG